MQMMFVGLIKTSDVQAERITEYINTRDAP